MTPTTYTPIRTKDYLSLVDDFPDNVPVTVVHMLRFNPTAIYPASSPHASLAPISGRDAFYQRYIPAGTAAAQEFGIQAGESRFFSTTVTNLLIHNDTPWDVVAVRAYKTFGEYARYQASQQYKENAVPHRDAALMDWSLVACVEDEYPPRK